MISLVKRSTARLHDGLEARPADFEVLGVGGQGAPDVGHEVDLLGRLDVPEYPLDNGIGIILLYQFDSRQAPPRDRTPGPGRGTRWGTRLLPLRLLFEPLHSLLDVLVHHPLPAVPTRVGSQLHLR